MSYVDGAPPGIGVSARHAKPLFSAELVGPDRTVLAAAGSIERDATAGNGGFGMTPNVGVGVFGGSGGGIGTGIGLGFPLGGGPAQAPSDPYRYRARIPIADTSSYREHWERSLVRLRFGTPADNVSAEIPAPAPRNR